MKLSAKAEKVLRVICIVFIVLGTVGFVLLGGTEGGVIAIVSGVVAGIGLVGGVVAGLVAIFKKIFK